MIRVKKNFLKLTLDKSHFITGAKVCGTLNMTTDELNGRMMTYLIKSLELAMKEHNFCMIDEAESLIKEYRELHDRFQQMLERKVEANDDDSNI